MPSWPAESIRTGTALCISRCSSPNAGDKSSCLNRHVANTDSVGFASNTLIPNVDVAIPHGEILAGCIAQTDVEAACGIVTKGGPANGCVLVAGGVVAERGRSAGCIEVAGGVILKRISPGGRVAAASGVVIE